jgi:hypothetical protein
MQYYNKLNLEKVRAQTEHTIVVYRIMIEVVPKIIEVCRKFDGKNVNGKRFSTALEHAVPLHRVYVETVGNSFSNIIVWPNRLYADRHSIFLGYHSEGMLQCFDFNKWALKFDTENNLHHWLEQAENAVCSIEWRVADYNFAIEQFESARTNLEGLTLEANS